MNVRIKRIALPFAAVVLAATPFSPASAAVTKTRGTGTGFNVSWTEFDYDDALGLPGNVHVGYLYAESGAYGDYLYGGVTDFQCDPGESPFSGHGHHIVDEAADVAADTIDDVIDATIQDGDATVIDAQLMVDEIQGELSDEMGGVIADEVGACDVVQERYLDGQDVKISVDMKKKVAQISGNLSVNSGGHGEPSQVLGTPPVNITITGGDWATFEYSNTYRTARTKYSWWQGGRSFDGGVVTGGIGAMGFADDADDESYGSFNEYTFRTVDRVR